MADVYLDEIRETPELIARYKDFAGLSHNEPEDDHDEDESTLTESRFAGIHNAKGPSL